MAELPEIAKLAGQMHRELAGKSIRLLHLQQEKCGNLPPAEIAALTAGRKITGVTYRGKWLEILLEDAKIPDKLLLSPGMGADIWHFSETPPQSKYHVLLTLLEGGGFTVRFWWFGKLLLLRGNELAAEPLVRDIAIDPFSPAFTLPYFLRAARARNTGVKAMLLDQRRIGGIGNMYAHDILFLAGLHPLTNIKTLTDLQLEKLYNAIGQVLITARDKGAFAYETDFYGQKGNYGLDSFLVGYKKGFCPVCHTPIEKIKTGSTSTFICPKCQQLG